MPGEELEWQQVTLESVAWPTRDDEVAGIVCPAACERYDMIERRGALVQTRRTVHTSLATVAERHFAHRTFHG
jgi:hypothetical protein